MAVGFTRERERGGEGGDHTISHESGRQQACSGALSRHALFRQRQADVAVDQAVAHAVGERLAEAVGIADVRRIRTEPHDVMGRAAHRMRVRREVASP